MSAATAFALPSPLACIKIDPRRSAPPFLLLPLAQLRMAIEFPCARCGQLVRTPDSAAGKKGKCPSCGQVQRIPSSETPPPPKPPAQPAAPSASPPPAPSQPPPQKERPKPTTS